MSANAKEEGRPNWSRTRYTSSHKNAVEARPLNDLERIVWLLNRILDKLEGEPIQ